MMIDSSEITNARDRAREFWTPLFLPPPPPSPLLESCASLLLHSSSSWSPRDRLERNFMQIISKYTSTGSSSFLRESGGGWPSIYLSLSPSPPLSFPSRSAGRFTFAFYAFTNFSLAEMTHFASSRWKMQPTSLAGPCTLSLLLSFLYFLLYPPISF